MDINYKSNGTQRIFGLIAAIVFVLLWFILARIADTKAWNGYEDIILFVIWGIALTPVIVSGVMYKNYPIFSRWLINSSIIIDVTLLIVGLSSVG